MKTLRLLFFASLATAASAFAWDPLGHMLVGQIAWDQLTPETKAKVDELVAAFNAKEDSDADYDFVTIACWMDDIRSRTQDYNTWHYVNLPFTKEGTPESDEPNVIRAATEAANSLAGSPTPSQIPHDEAIAFLAHLVGDIHQPLHATSRNEDAGGNRVKVSNLKDPEVDLIFSKGGNLHFFWDSSYRRIFKDGKANVSVFTELYPRDKPVAGHKAALELVRSEATAIEKEFPPTIVKEQGTPDSWAHESHAIGYEFGYGKLPAGDPVKLDAAYVTEARKIARERIALAGYRLGHLLNEILGGEKK